MSFMSDLPFPELHWIPDEALGDMAMKVRDYAAVHAGAWPTEVTHERADGELRYFLHFDEQALACTLHGTDHLTHQEIRAGELLFLRAAEAVCRNPVRRH